MASEINGSTQSWGGTCIYLTRGSEAARITWWWASNCSQFSQTRVTSDTWAEQGPCERERERERERETEKTIYSEQRWCPSDHTWNHWSSSAAKFVPSSMCGIGRKRHCWKLCFMFTWEKAARQPFFQYERFLSHCYCASCLHACGSLADFPAVFLIFVTLIFVMKYKCKIMKISAIGGNPPYLTKMKNLALSEEWKKSFVFER